MTVKRSTVNNEKFDYSYVIIRRGKRDTSQSKCRTLYELQIYYFTDHDFGRLISTPVKRKRNIFMELCHSSGTFHFFEILKKQL